MNEKIKVGSLFSGIGGIVGFIKHPIPVTPMANKYTAQKVDVDKAIELYESGMTQGEVAKKLGTTQKVIWRRFRNIGYQCRVAKKKNQEGSNNDNWKGSKVQYAGAHRRVEAQRGKPRECSVCNTKTAKRYEWANLTGKYEDVNDYKRMCKSCHAKHDGVIRNITSPGGDV